MLNNHAPIKTLKQTSTLWIKLLIIIAAPSMSLADTMSIYYEGIITKGNGVHTVIPIGHSNDKPNGYVLGDSISGRIDINTDIAASFEPTSVEHFIGISSLYNTPDPKYDNLRIEYSRPHYSVDDDQGFITGGYNSEPSVTNHDSIIINNGASRSNVTGPSAEFNSRDSMVIRNRDNLHDNQNQQWIPLKQTTTQLSFSAESFLNGISLNQNFVLSAPDFLSQKGVIRNSDSFGNSPSANFSRNPVVNDLIEFDLTLIRVETVSGSEIEECN